MYLFCIEYMREAFELIKYISLLYYIILIFLLTTMKKTTNKLNMSNRQ